MFWRKIMAVRYLSLEEVEKLAGSIWRAPKTKAVRYGANDDKKLASFPAFGLENRSTEFPMRSGEWKQVGKYEVMIEYPRWDIPGRIHVRKIARL